jgi:hypothetical protein
VVAQLLVAWPEGARQRSRKAAELPLHLAVRSGAAEAVGVLVRPLTLYCASSRDLLGLEPHELPPRQ